MHRILILSLPFFLMSSAAFAESPSLKIPPPNPVALLSPGNPDALAGALRGYLVHNLPPTLYEASPGWGHTAHVANGLQWMGKHLPLQPHVKYAEKNDGDWRKVRVTADNPADTFLLDIRNLQRPNPGRITFDAFVSLDARVEYEHQKWESGVRIYSVGAQGTLRVKVLLSCEATMRLEQGSQLLPDAVFRLHVTQAQLSYDNLVVKHIAGVGGEAAKLIGDSLKGGLHQWHPSWEKEMLAKADVAIAKACDTKEVRVSLSKVLGKKN